MSLCVSSLLPDCCLARTPQSQAAVATSDPLLFAGAAGHIDTLPPEALCNGHREQGALHGACRVASVFYVPLLPHAPLGVLQNVLCIQPRSPLPVPLLTLQVRPHRVLRPSATLVAAGFQAVEWALASHLWPAVAFVFASLQTVVTTIPVLALQVRPHRV